jgi:hypothetical protein
MRKWTARMTMTTYRGDSMSLGLDEADGEHQQYQKEQSEFRKAQLPLNDAFDHGCRTNLAELVVFAHKLACRQVERSAATVRNPHAKAYHRDMHERDVAVRDQLGNARVVASGK